MRQTCYPKNTETDYNITVISNYSELTWQAVKEREREREREILRSWKNTVVFYTYIIATLHDEERQYGSKLKIIEFYKCISNCTIKLV